MRGVTEVGPHTGANLLWQTVEALSERAPAVVAAAAAEMRGIRLGLHFNDTSAASMSERHSRLLVVTGEPLQPDVEVVFDNRAMNALFDLRQRPVEQVQAGSFDFRGDPDQVLAVWRAFTLLSQRASGLRHIQSMWQTYREHAPQLWGNPSGDGDQGGSGTQSGEATGWAALDYLTRHPARPAGGGCVAGTVVPVPRSLWDGRGSSRWWDTLSVTDADLVDTMAACKTRVASEMLHLIPDREPRVDLYALMREYPARQGKGLRPTLTIAACVALGGRAEDAVRAAAALELFHNGFLVHDDIADESTHRRGLPTLHAQYGEGLAVNVGDGLNLLAVDALVSNLENLGLARTLGLIREAVHMCRESIEGQAMELGWIHREFVPESDADYFVMSTKKTGWYTCMSPCRIGAVCAGVTDPRLLDRFDEAFRLIGIAFQIQDDILNLVGDTARYGKEALGDLLEGKRTVMLIELMRRTEDPAERVRLHAILRRRRADRTQADAQELLEAMRRCHAIDYAVRLADRLADEGIARFETDLSVIPENEGKAVLRQIAHYVTTRPL